MNNIIYIFSLIPIIIFLVEIAIKLGFPRKLSLLACFIFSIIPSALFFTHNNLKGSILYSILIATSTTGTFSSYKNIIQYINKKLK